MKLYIVNKQIIISLDESTVLLDPDNESDRKQLTRYLLNFKINVNSDILSKVPEIVYLGTKISKEFMHSISIGASDDIAQLISDTEIIGIDGDKLFAYIQERAQYFLKEIAEIDAKILLNNPGAVFVGEFLPLSI